MRTISAGALSALKLEHRSTHLKVEVYNSSWVDLTDLEGHDWVVEASWGEDIDSPAKVADIKVRRRIEQLSTVPFDDNSKINASATLIDLGVAIRISTANPGQDVEPVSADWSEVFKGYIDAIAWQADPIVLNCRDGSAVPMDWFIEDQLVYPGDGTADTKVEDLMQDILDDNNEDLDTITANLTWNGTLTVTTADTSEAAVGDFIAYTNGAGQSKGPFFEIDSLVLNTSYTLVNPSGRSIPTGNGASSSYVIPAASRQTLYSVNGSAATPFNGGDSPSWDILAYEQRKIHVLEALKILAAQIGYDVRYTWQATLAAYALVFYLPDRTKSSADATFSQSNYHKISKLSVNRANVRNVVRVTYNDSTSGVPASVEVSNGASITKYGRRFMEICEGPTSQIDTSTEATLLANAGLSDLKEPTADHAVEMPYFWPVELGDLYTWTANDVHYSSDQSLAVRGYRHTISARKARTVLQCRGTPAGGFKRWLSMESRLGVGQANDQKTVTTPANVAATAAIEGIVVTFDDPVGVAPPVKDWAYAECYVHTADPGSPPNSTYLKGAGRMTRFEIRGLTPDTLYYARVVLYDASGNKSAASALVSATAGQVESPVYVADNAIGVRQSIGDNIGANYNFDGNVYSLGSGYPPEGWTVI